MLTILTDEQLKDRGAKIAEAEKTLQFLRRNPSQESRGIHRIVSGCVRGSA
jgi:hypothetical protein